MQSSFDKVILVHKCITKFPAYLRMQGIFNAFRDKRTKSKPILRYRTSPKREALLLYSCYAVFTGCLGNSRCNRIFDAFIKCVRKNVVGVEFVIAYK